MTITAHNSKSTLITFYLAKDTSGNDIGAITAFLNHLH